VTTYSKESFSRPTALFGPSRCFSINRRKRGGFTLIELLVVVGIIGILAGLLLPALERSKSRGQAIMCMNNYRHLGLSWTMYSTDNNDRLAYNQAPNRQTLTFASPSSPNWVNNIMDWELTPGNTNVDFVNQSVLGYYANFSPSIYHCPADRALSSVQINAGWTKRVRSVSMNAMVGDPGSVLQNETNVNNPGFEQFVKESDFRDPSSIFVFLDEHPDSIDDGYFLNTDTNLEWVDLPASYHNGGGSFSFADGHTEIHRWVCASTVRPPQPGAADLVMKLAPNDTADFNWVLKRTSIPVR
jgi:prepilin-type N-terminal cleavage/methylation domain-containing protein/prepilin-type processing-associated H-X9-DG protein